MVKVAFASLLGLASAGGKLALTWEDCGTSSTHGHTDKVEPSEIVIGEEQTIVGTGSTDKEIKSGTFSMKLTASLGIKETYTGKICEAKQFEMPLGLGTVSWAGMACPVSVGPSTVKIGLKMASTLPAALAKADMALTALDQDGEQAVCVNTHLKKESALQLRKGSASQKQYAKGFILGDLFAANAAIQVTEISDEMRASVPDALDWTTLGATSPVKDQGACGSCWAFSATEAIESAVFILSEKMETPPPILAPQQIVSCDTMRGDGNRGCMGGNPITAYQYVEKAGGLEAEHDYPYTSGNCTFHWGGGECQPHLPGTACKRGGKKLVKVTDWKYAVKPCQTLGHSSDCKGQDEDGLKAALFFHGPLSIVVNAHTWQNYSSGVLDEECPGTMGDLDHAVQLVGYNTTGSTPYWKVRNSWATEWGEEGFIRLPMGNNSCGLANLATYAVAAMVETDETSVLV